MRPTFAISPVRAGVYLTHIQFQWRTQKSDVKIFIAACGARHDTADLLITFEQNKLWTARDIQLLRIRIVTIEIPIQVHEGDSVHQACAIREALFDHATLDLAGATPFSLAVYEDGFAGGLQVFGLINRNIEMIHRGVTVGHQKLGPAS